MSIWISEWAKDIRGTMSQLKMADTEYWEFRVNSDRICYIAVSGQMLLLCEFCINMPLRSKASGLFPRVHKVCHYLFVAAQIFFSLLAS